MSKFIDELKRRNVIKSTIAYLVVSWILLQIFTVLLPIVNAPDWVLKTLTLILAIGLPIWIIISWVYDITPEGIEKTPEASEKQLNKQLTNKRLNAFLITSLSIAVIVLTLKVTGVFSSSSNNNYSIAVLAFDNMSNDTEQEFFSDGISEDIINMLSKVELLKVISRTSSFFYKGKDIGMIEIGEQLNVTHILEGSVRRSGNTLRITVTLINAADGSELFSEKYDRVFEDVFAIQDEISRDILKATKIKLFGEEEKAVLKRNTDNIDAYDFYSEGRFHMNKFTREGFLKAIEFFDKAIAIDSTYAIAYADKAFCYMNLIDIFGIDKNSRPLAIEAAEQAIKYDDQIAESQLAIGRINLHWNWNVRDAMAAFKKALVINPNSAQANVQLGFCLVQLGQFEEAIKHANIAKNLDRFAPLNLYYVNSVFVWIKDIETTLSIANEIIDLDEDNIGAHVHKSLALFQFGQIDEALVELEILTRLDKLDFVVFGHGVLSAIKGDTSKASAAIEELKKNGSQSYDIGMIYSMLGDLDNAFYYLNKAVENRHPLILWIKLNATPEILNDPRFAELEKKMNIVY